MSSSSIFFLLLASSVLNLLPIRGCLMASLALAGASMNATSLRVTTLPLAMAAMPLTFLRFALATGDEMVAKRQAASMAVRVLMCFMVVILSMRFLYTVV